MTLGVKQFCVIEELESLQDVHEYLKKIISDGKRIVSFSVMLRESQFSKGAHDMEYVQRMNDAMSSAKTDKDLEIVLGMACREIYYLVVVFEQELPIRK